jgi:hypothetical protein
VEAAIGFGVPPNESMYVLETAFTKVVVGSKENEEDCKNV